jgi:hypothetical protein
VFVASCHPGPVRSEITKDLSWWQKGFTYALFPFLWYVTRNAQQGAQTLIYLSAEPDLPAKLKGKYFVDCAPAPVLSPIGDDPILPQKLWEVSEKLSSMRHASQDKFEDNKEDKEE